MFSLLISQGFSMHACPERRGPYCVLGREEISADQIRMGMYVSRLHIEPSAQRARGGRARVFVNFR
jgi:hypothetical protein